MTLQCLIIMNQKRRKWMIFYHAREKTKKLDMVDYGLQIPIYLLAGWIIFFWPAARGRRERKIGKYILYLLFVAFAMILNIIIRVDNFWLFIIAGGKISILNLYEVCQMLLETEDERDAERVRRLKLWFKSMGYYILLTICLMA